MKEIILASASPRRFELLKQVGLDFKVIPSRVEEDLDALPDAVQLVQNLAYEKALSVAREVSSDSIIIGADTVVVKEEILGKPKDEKEAFDMLRSLQGHWHEVITGVSVIDCMTLKSLSSYEITRVKMRKLSVRAIEAYINTGEPFDKAGSYGIQGKGALIVEKIEGCYFNVVGLPLSKLAEMLETFGIRVL